MDRLIFKNNFHGSGNAQALGNVGAYYAIGTGILPNSFLAFWRWIGIGWVSPYRSGNPLA
jgi:hypothetical protein